MESQPEERLMSRREVAEALNISYTTLRRWVERGWLQPVQLPSGTYRYRASEVDEIRERTPRKQVLAES